MVAGSSPAARSTRTAICAGFLTRAAAFLHAHGITRIERVLTDNAEDLCPGAASSMVIFRTRSACSQRGSARRAGRGAPAARPSNGVPIGMGRAIARSARAAHRAPGSGSGTGSRPAGAYHVRAVAGVTSTSAARQSRLTQHLDVEWASENGDPRTRSPPESRPSGVIALFIRASIPAAGPGLAG
jgi:hypothetical protein